MLPWIPWIPGAASRGSPVARACPASRKPCVPCVPRVSLRVARKLRAGPPASRGSPVARACPACRAPLLYAGMLGPGSCVDSIQVFLRLNNSGRCAISADRLRRYRSRQSVRCLTSRSAAFCSDSSVSTQAPSTRIAPVGGLPLGRFCGDAISLGKERVRYRLNARSAVAAREGMRS